jgi:hypothetical protein
LLAGILLVLVAIAAVLVFNNTDSTDTASTEPGALPSTTVAETTTTEASTTTEVEATTTIAETTTTEASTTTQAETTTTIAELTDDTAAEAAMDWIDALAAGEADTAFDLVAPESQIAFGGRAGFDGSFSGLVEGFGAWADATGVYGEGDPWVFANRVNDDTIVVTLAGAVSQEGSDGQRAAAIPVVIRNGRALVQPFLRAGTTEFITPMASDVPEVLEAGPVFEVIVPGDPTVRMYVFTTEAQLTVTSLGNGTSQVVSAPFFNIEPGGISVLTVFFTEGDAVQADALLFQVGEGEGG